MSAKQSAVHVHANPAPKLTAGRRIVLDELEAEGRPLGAYDIIDRVAAKSGKRLAPISVYRALDFLVETGLVHRLASRNAFLACAHSHGDEDVVAFLICESCGAVKEASSAPMRDSLHHLAAKANFAAHSQIVEIAGLCGACQSA